MSGNSEAENHGPNGSDPQSPPESEPTTPPTPPAIPVRSSTFSFIGKSIADCPRSASWCADYWPPAEEGTVYLYSISEIRTDSGDEIIRTAYLYRPIIVTKPSPVLFFLHGGTSSGDDMFEKIPFSSIADGRGQSNGVAWLKNSANCKWNAEGTGFENSTGQACTGRPSIFRNSLPFLVVFPNGVLDKDSNRDRHWQDGRVPSPGFGDTAENRDDVGFIDSLIGVVRKEEADVVDSERIYIGGASNGGLMTLRLACNTSTPGLTELSRVAAFGSLVATMSEAGFRGIEGREKCSNGFSPYPIALMVGKDVPTPNCLVYGCAEPNVSGDERMPFGELGGVYSPNSPDLGSLISFPDVELSVRQYFKNGGAGVENTTLSEVGYFTKRRTYTYSQTLARIEVWETERGYHNLLSTRMDFVPPARIWEFLSSYRRLSDGSFVITEPSHLSGSF
ncbi:MAG: hypothetical protein IPJ71_00075 [Bdellovibrionales bacterium]|nr:hypothetical protein [Bdellovibrionales bacterium]